MTQLADRLADVRDRIAAACARARRPANSVQLIAVSKLQPVELIRAAYVAGQRDFGENYAQELRDKAASLADLKDIRWHSIGPLQGNKAKYVARTAFAFHAVDRVEIAQELSRRRTGAPLRCFLEVNVAGEASKSGAPPADIPALLPKVRALPSLDVVGLMALPPLGDPEATRRHFRAVADLARSLNLKELSLGTTADYEVAIEEGATFVRVGTAIFGEREPRAPTAP